MFKNAKKNRQKTTTFASKYNLDNCAQTFNTFCIAL